MEQRVGPENSINREDMTIFRMYFLYILFLKKDFVYFTAFCPMHLEKQQYSNKIYLYRGKLSFVVCRKIEVDDCNDAIVYH